MEKIRIIIADDHQLFRNGLKILLNAFPDFEVVAEASNGEEFLRILENTPVDVVLMDINMPDMDGYALTAKIRKVPGFASVPIIAVTANVMRGDREKSLEAGCDRHLKSSRSRGHNRNRPRVRSGRKGER